MRGKAGLLAHRETSLPASLRGSVGRKTRRPSIEKFLFDAVGLRRGMRRPAASRRPVVRQRQWSHRLAPAIRSLGVTLDEIFDRVGRECHAQRLTHADPRSARGLAPVVLVVPDDRGERSRTLPVLVRRTPVVPMARGPPRRRRTPSARGRSAYQSRRPLPSPSPARAEPLRGLDGFFLRAILSLAYGSVILGRTTARVRGRWRLMMGGGGGVGMAGGRPGENDPNTSETPR